MRKSMDGKNVDTVLMELGVRFHRLIHEHLQQYGYSSMGGMLAICDVAEYRRCAKDFRVSGGGGGGDSGGGGGGGSGGGGGGGGWHRGRGKENQTCVGVWFTLPER